MNKLIESFICIGCALCSSAFTSSNEQLLTDPFPTRRMFDPSRIKVLPPAIRSEILPTGTIREELSDGTVRFNGVFSVDPKTIFVERPHAPCVPLQE
jgi:hypothetical protein